MSDTTTTAQPPGARPYESLLDGEHDLDESELQRSLQDPAFFADCIIQGIQERAKALPDTPQNRVIQAALAPGGNAFGADGSPFSFLVEALAEIIGGVVVERLNVLIDTINYLHLGQPGYIPDGEAWGAPQYPSSLPGEDQNPITRL